MSVYAAWVRRAGPQTLGGSVANCPLHVAGFDSRDEPPARQTSWSEPLTPGTWNLVWNGADGAAPSDGVTAGVVAISWWNGEAWDSYFPSAGNVPGLNTLASLNKGAAYWVVVE